MPLQILHCYGAVALITLLPALLWRSIKSWVSVSFLMLMCLQVSDHEVSISILLQNNLKKAFVILNIQIRVKPHLMPPYWMPRTRFLFGFCWRRRGTVCGIFFLFMSSSSSFGLSLMTMRLCVRACTQESGSTLTPGWSPMTTEMADLEQSADWSAYKPKETQTHKIHTDKHRITQNYMHITCIQKFKLHGDK